MPTKFDADLGILKEKQLKMGALAEQMIRGISAVVVDREEQLLDGVAASEEQMDVLQNEIDEETVRLIAVHTPVAGDLRLLIVITRLNAEIERIGDQVMNIAFYAKTLLKEDPLDGLAGISELGRRAREMLAKGLDAFTHQSGDLARSVIGTDDEVDQLHDQLFRELMRRAIGDAAVVSRVLELILIARAFERIADHAVSIAEDVIYCVEGKDIRHVDDPGPGEPT